jgi:NAD(P)H dehydrogenase (quinone)
MHFLVLFAHPLRESFQAAAHGAVLKGLSDAGHQVDDCDLYAEGFQPVLSGEERRVYHQLAQNRRWVQAEVDRLMRCEGLVFVYPAWMYGMPAILKGYLDRVLVPGVAFKVVAGRTVPLLGHIKRFAVVTSYGSPWWLNTFILGDPNRRVMMRGIRHLVARDAGTLWLALYGIDYTDVKARQRFLDRVERQLRTF